MKFSKNFFVYCVLIGFNLVFAPRAFYVDTAGEDASIDKSQHEHVEQQHPEREADQQAQIQAGVEQLAEAAEPEEFFGRCVGPVQMLEGAMHVAEQSVAQLSKPWLACRHQAASSAQGWWRWGEAVVQNSARAFGRGVGATRAVCAAVSRGIDECLVPPEEHEDILLKRHGLVRSEHSLPQGADVYFNNGLIAQCVNGSRHLVLIQIHDSQLSILAHSLDINQMRQIIASLVGIHLRFEQELKSTASDFGLKCEYHLRSSIYQQYHIHLIFTDEEGSTYRSSIGLQADLSSAQDNALSQALKSVNEVITLYLDKCKTMLSIQYQEDGLCEVSLSKKGRRAKKLPIPAEFLSDGQMSYANFVSFLQHLKSNVHSVKAV